MVGDSLIIEPACRSCHANGPGDLLTIAEYGVGNGGYLRIALAKRDMEQVTANLIVWLSGFASEGKKHASWRTSVEGQQIAGPGVMPDGLRRIHTKEADPHIAFANVECRALAGLLSQPTQGRLDVVFKPKAGLVERSQSGELWAEAEGRVVVAHEVAGSGKRPRETENGRLRQVDPSCQFRQAQGPVVRRESIEHCQCTLDGNHPTFLPRFAIQGFPGHERFTLCNDSPFYEIALKCAAVKASLKVRDFRDAAVVPPLDEEGLEWVRNRDSLRFRNVRFDADCCL
jgi:hypothetical protein